MLLNRRSFLLSAAALRAAGEPKRIAAIVTEYRPNSHADVIVGKYLEGYRQDGRPPQPRSRIVSLYTAQVPPNDLSRERAQKYGVPIYPAIPEALTLGTGRLAVDGVLLIGEHGDYPTNEKGQKLYPRYELFMEITDVFRKTGRAVPVFNDKHLSYSWGKARRMVEISRQLNFPMLAGSSVPVAYRKPQVETPSGARIRHAVAIGYSGLEVYGFHMLESLQCMVERRSKGETGVAAVRCLENDAVWKYLGQTPWAQKLFDQAMARSETRKPGPLREQVKAPAAFLIDYRDGLKAACSPAASWTSRSNRDFGDTRESPRPSWTCATGSARRRISAEKSRSLCCNVGPAVLPASPLSCGLVFPAQVSARASSATPRYGNSKLTRASTLAASPRRLSCRNIRA